MDAKTLSAKLKRIGGQGYGAYKELKGVYQFSEGTLFIDKVQSDPFAPPSLLRLKIPGDLAQIPSHFYNNPSRKVGLENYLAYKASQLAQKFSRKIGTGKGGLIKVHGPGQEILPRTALELDDNGGIELRFFVGLPAAGRRILAKEAQKILLDYLPKLAKALCYPELDHTFLKAFVEINEDADFLRDRLKALGLIAFVADGSILPRASGIDPKPAKNAVPFKAPDSLAVEIDLPNRGRVRGLGIRPGVTLIAGGGFHGKSTLLRALELGIYNHIPGDGRELVVTSPLAVKIRAEDGRKITGVDISPFINNLPLGLDTKSFTTDCASGSTSQAANIMEALELFADVLLIDEDTSATNFMIRDLRMQMLVSKEKEPITPFLDRVRELYEIFGVSSILVIGGCGDYLDVADTVIVMDNYLPKDATIEARNIIQKYPSNRLKEDVPPFKKPNSRYFLPESFPKVSKSPKAKSRDTVLWGKEVIDLSAVEQIVSVDQTRAISLALPLLAEQIKQGKNLLEGLNFIEMTVKTKGLKCLSGMPRGDLAFFRPMELAAALNRLRSLRVKDA
ncbi:ABC transporter, ATPase, predicted [Thermodesulfatator indicus DSM 15286]|uniref:ABC transporter, ATPase, predicted n=1 Tax=Thermodesulfatator indicus (strain DSM 15286 / JCM 11887 / CIR29812) TaxID=667014 RepID=F8ACE3_THEID|nr:ABC-ATPase domain-containing protein [Thermodesulfatator indicus]AEH44644.1 ABC transporter, ATPase, predicted [Thermodesulfatator indicus DSM 15286]